MISLFSWVLEGLWDLKRHKSVAYGQGYNMSKERQITEKVEGGRWGGCSLWYEREEAVFEMFKCTFPRLFRGGIGFQYWVISSASEIRTSYHHHYHSSWTYPSLCALYRQLLRYILYRKFLIVFIEYSLEASVIITSTWQREKLRFRGQGASREKSWGWDLGLLSAARIPAFLESRVWFGHVKSWVLMRPAWREVSLKQAEEVIWKKKSFWKLHPQAGTFWTLVTLTCPAQFPELGILAAR